jgi:hypothetical protein
MYVWRENSCYGGGSSYNGFSIVPIYTFALLSTLLLTVTFSQTLGTLTPCTVPWRGVACGTVQWERVEQWD